jgi:3-oxoacyl-[acyl-carrier protein] reductase
LEGKSALVTGGARGFGLGIVETFAREGARVAVVDVNGDAARKVAEGIPGAIAIAADVSKAADVNRAVQETIQAFGGLDVLVNNAGISHRNRPMLEVEEDEFDRVFAVNVKSQGRGVIVNVGSTAGLRPRPGLAWYNGTKGAVHSITKSMAIELAPDRIRVCALAPVAGDTPLLATFMGEDTPEKRAAFRSTIPLGRLSRPDDIANAALFLASDEADLVTGVVLEVDGGRCI